MNNIFKIPEPIEAKLDELGELVKKYPQKIPSGELAKFLGMDKECLRRAIEQNKVPFAIGCDTGKYGNRYFHIPTATFYFWYVSPLMRVNQII